MPGLLSLIPLKDWVYGALIAALLAFGVYEVNHLKAEGAAHEVAVLQASSAKLTADAQKQVVATATAYAKSLTKVKGDLDEQVKTAAVQHDSDAQRLRDYDAYRRQHAALGSAGGGSGSQSAGASSAISVDDVLAGMEQAGLSLASANRLAAAALTACAAERESLTGK